jgi:hypothetical protein
VVEAPPRSVVDDTAKPVSATPARRPVLPEVPPPTPTARLIPQTLLPDLQSRWNEVAQAALRDGQPLIASALSGSRPVSFANGTLTLECPADFCDRSDADPLVLQVVVAVIANVCGHRLTIRVRPPAGLDGGRSARYAAAEAHPLVQALRKRFAADIITREPITREEWLKRCHPGPGMGGSQPGEPPVAGV